jgi:hypothetical protein
MELALAVAPVMLMATDCEKDFGAAIETIRTTAARRKTLVMVKRLIIEKKAFTGDWNWTG